MSVSLSLPSMHHKKYYYSMLPCLQRVPCAISAPPTVPRPIYGRLFKVAVNSLLMNIHDFLIMIFVKL